MAIGARVSLRWEAFILWYQVGEQSPVVVGGSVVVGDAAREGNHQELLPMKFLPWLSHPSPASFPLSLVSLARRVGAQPGCHGRVVSVYSWVHREIPTVYLGSLAGLRHSVQRLWLNKAGLGNRAEARGSSPAFLSLLCTMVVSELVCQCP